VIINEYKNFTKELKQKIYIAKTKDNIRRKMKNTILI
jgi:hypothetical protein